MAELGKEPQAFWLSVHCLNELPHLCESPGLRWGGTSSSPRVFVLLASFINGEFMPKQLPEGEFFPGGKKKKKHKKTN